MAFTKLIAFDRPLAAVVIPGQPGRLFTEAELAAKTEDAFHRGQDSAREAADQQMVEFRADVEHLTDGVLKKLSALETSMLGQIRESLPGLAVEIARRLLAGYEPPAEVVDRLCGEALAQLFPERDGLELSLHPRDAALLQDLNPAWLQQYPGLKIRQDTILSPGDCQVRSRFGLTDARQSTKLAALQHHLTGA